MKTSITLEFETKDMKKVVPEEFINNPDKCPKDKLLTSEVEKQLHKVFVEYIERFADKGSQIYEDLDSTMCDDVPVEGLDFLEDYGRCTITVKSK